MRNKTILANCFLATNLFLAPIANAGGLDSLMKFAERGGSMTSINAGGVIEDQRSGYLTGGSMIVRGPRPVDLQPLAVQLPSFKFDACTGSGDLRWGGFSYIKGREFSDFLKGIAAKTPAYVVKMLLKTVKVQSENIISDLEAIARDINGMTFNQCEQSKKIAEGLLGRVSASATQKCMTKSAIARDGKDLYETTQKCQDNPDRFGTQGDDAELKSMLPDNYNLVWRALSHGNGQAPNGMKELMLSIAGSIIGKKENGRMVIKSLPSLIEQEDLLEQYMGNSGFGSSEVRLYKCDEASKCLNPTLYAQRFDSRSDTLYGQVERILQSIIGKISGNKGDLTDEEQALIEYSQIPIIPLFEIELSTRSKESVISLAGDTEFIEVVCYDLVVNFMRKMLLQAKSAVEQLQVAQVDNTPIERFNRSSDQVQEYLRDKKHHAMQKLQTIVAVKERLAQQQKLFQLGFSRFADH